MRKEAIQHCGWNPVMEWPRKRLKFEALILDMIVGLPYYEAYAKVQDETRGLFHGFRDAALGIVNRVFSFGVDLTQLRHNSHMRFDSRGEAVRKRSQTREGFINVSLYGSVCFAPLKPTPRHFWRTTKDVRTLRAHNCTIVKDQEEYYVSFRSGDILNAPAIQLSIPKAKALRLIQLIQHRNRKYRGKPHENARRHSKRLRRAALTLMREKGFRAYMLEYGPKQPTENARVGWDKIEAVPDPEWVKTAEEQINSPSEDTTEDS